MDSESVTCGCPLSGFSGSVWWATSSSMIMPVTRRTGLKPVLSLRKSRNGLKPEGMPVKKIHDKVEAALTKITTNTGSWPGSFVVPVDAVKAEFTPTMVAIEEADLLELIKIVANGHIVRKCTCNHCMLLMRLDSKLNFIAYPEGEMNPVHYKLDPALVGTYENDPVTQLRLRRDTLVQRMDALEQEIDADMAARNLDPMTRARLGLVDHVQTCVPVDVDSKMHLKGKPNHVSDTDNQTTDTERT